tara:strand:- start:67 stop:1086 length:1020 start_codon:yes stop_codon:yes gene_type:complete
LKRGIESYTISLANKLAEKRRIKVVIYAWKGENRDFIKRLNDNILIRTLPLLRYFQKIQAYIFYHIWLKIDNPSKVIFNFFYHGESFLPKNLKYILVLHSPPSTIPNRYKFIKQKINLFKNLEIVAVSNFVKRESETIFPKHKINVIYNGINLNQFKLKKVKDSPNLRIVTLSALEERKRIQNIILALKKIKNPNLRFHIYGDGPYKKKIKSLINKENLQKYVKLKGVTNEPENIFCDYDIFILISKGEAFPISPIEAMSCGLPLIVSNEEPFDEIVSKDCGILIDPNNQKQIIDSILLLEDKTKRKDLGISARSKVQQHFSDTTMGDMYIKLIFKKFI